MNGLLAKLRALFRKEKLERNMAEEMRFHLAQRAAENLDDGLAADEARYAAQRKFGNVGVIQERCRDEQQFRWLEQLARDLRHAMRSLAKARGFSVVAILTLAVGLGANTAIFSAVYSILFRPLPFHESDQLVSVRTMAKREMWERRGFSNPDFRDYRRQATASFDGLAAIDGVNLTLTADGEALRIRGEMVSHDYFRVLHARPALGRTFTAEEDRAPDLAPLVVLSHDIWRTRFAASPNVLGQRLRLNDVDYLIIGVMPENFQGVEDSAQLWVPMTTIGAETWNNRGSRGRDVIGRLKRGVTLEQARAELAAIGAQLATEFPQTNTNYSTDAVPLRDEFFGGLRRPLLVLLGAVGLVLVITCVNVANLLLVRLTTRHREIAIRISLGAGRAALARLFMIEAFALSLIGAGLSVLFAHWFIVALKRLAPIDLPGFVTLDLQWSAFAFAGTVALLCALAIGALPALLAARADLNSALKDAGRTGHSGSAGGRMRATLVAAELALSLALVVASTLFVRSFVNLMTQTPGYRTEKLVFQRVLLPSQRYPDMVRRTFFHTLIERTAALPGVRSVALATDSPLEGNTSAASFTVENDVTTAENGVRAYTHAVSREFFACTGMALIQGETFAGSYVLESEPVAIVSEKFARRFWSAGGALGQRFKQRRANVVTPWIRIIGVVAENKYRGLARDLGSGDPDIYFAIEQRLPAGFSILVQTAADSSSVGASVRKLVNTIDPMIPVFGFATIEQRITGETATQRFNAQLMGAFAIIALTLAAIGLYGVVSFGVGQRRREIGVRMALGAQPADIARMILRGTGRLVAVGLTAGVALAWALMRFAESLLFGVNANDPLTYMVVALGLLLVALFASWLPARRAAQVDPMVALRSE